MNIGKKLGPLIAPLLNLMAQAISWGAKGLEFLSRNLWMIAVAFAWFLGFFLGINERYKQN